MENKVSFEDKVMGWCFGALAVSFTVFVCTIFIALIANLVNRP